MNRGSLRQLGRLVVLICGLHVLASYADPVSAVQLLRVSGCAGVLPAMRPLQHNRQLDRAAALWAAGGSPVAAALRTGYQAQSVVGLHLRGPDDSILRALRRTRCRAVTGQSLSELGSYRMGVQAWVVIASLPAATALNSALPSSRVESSRFAPRVLELVNQVRSRGTRCGERAFGPAPPLQFSATLDRVAAEHALDMARHDYFEHVDLTGRTPADRLRATGYRERLVGENIAYGPTSADEVVAGWLHSSGHCENIMDARFVEMGLAHAPGQGARRGLYWDQELATPAK
ncbi:MAG TPA: CAP domain-containing protein [Steroidobacteraceae bacterium]